MVFAAKNSGETLTFWGIIIFLLIHLMPVWIYICGVLTTALRYRNSAYIITDKGIYVSSGLFAKTYQMKPFADLAHVNLHRGIFDQLIGVGDVICCDNTMPVNYPQNYNQNKISICNISDYRRVFKMVKNLQTDIYSDTMYPNKLRPDENPGYRTRYNADYNRD